MPPTAIRAGLPSEQFTPAIGSLDGGLGFKHAIHSHYWYQDAVEVFVTIPIGSKAYTLGTPSYTFTYVGAFSPPGNFGINTSFSLVNAPGQPENGGPERRFASYAPSIRRLVELEREHEPARQRQRGDTNRSHRWHVERPARRAAARAFARVRRRRRVGVQLYARRGLQPTRHRRRRRLFHLVRFDQEVVSCVHVYQFVP